MERLIDRYSDGESDLLVIGGGITGAAVAYVCLANCQSRSYGQFE